MFSFWKDFSKETRKILLACFFAFFFNGLMAMMLGSILPDMKQTYGLTDTQSGLMLSAHSAGNLVACFLSGLVPLYLGRKKGIILMGLMASLGYSMMMISGNPIWLAAAFLFAGIGRGSVSNFNNGTVNRLTHGNPSASNLLHSTFAVGAISAPMVFLLASRVAGWRAAVICILALGVCVAINFSRQQFSDNWPSRADKTQKSMKFLKNRTFLILAAMSFFYLCSEYAINGWLVTFLQNKPRLLEEFASNGADAQARLKAYSQSMATLLWAIILAGRLVMAVLARKRPQKLLMMADSIGVALFFALLLFSNQIAVVTAAVAGLGFCMAGICPMIYSDASYITNVYPMGTSTLLAVGSVGAMIMPALVGVMADKFGFTGGMGCILGGILTLVLLSVCNCALKAQPIDAPQKNKRETEA